MSTAPLTRRSLLRGSGVVAIAGVAGFLVTRRTSAARANQGVANAYGAPAPATAQPLTRLDRIPPGGGIVLAGPRIVLTRDSAGGVHGFSAVCPHQGCTVNEVQAGRIGCPCHGSRFDAATGEVVRGPATTGLRPVAVVVRDAQVFPQ